MLGKEPLDFLAVGDVVTDAFIKLSAAWVDEETPKHPQGLCVNFGDKVPYDEVEVIRAVGNAANAAAASAKLGLKTALVVWVGDDEEGRKCRETIRAAGVSDEFVTTEAGKPTNYHYVLRFGPERTILVKHTLWSYRFPEVTPAPRWIYLSSLAKDTESYHDEISDYLDRHPETKLALQPGTFQMKLGAARLKRLYRRSDIFFCNREEAARILEIPPAPVVELLPKVRALGPKIVVITDGPDGAFAQDESGATFFVPMFPDAATPISRTGAGDACGSTITAALALGLPLQEALRWGPVNSAAVVQKVGAQTGLLSRAELESRLAGAPAEYTVTTV